MSEGAAAQREALRQQQLLRALWRRGTDASLTGWLRDSGARAEQGLDAYRGNAHAIAERALAAAFPTVQQLVGDDSFALLARALWHHHPPRCGDLARFGDALPAWIADDPQLAAEPYLADVARVDWAVHTIEHAADAPPLPADLHLLGEREPARLRLRLRPGLACIASRWPVVTIWRAHRSGEVDRFAPARDALAAGRREIALVARPQWRATVDAIDEPNARFTTALLGGAPLARALDAAGPTFAFEAWLHDAVRQQWLQAVEPVAEPDSGAAR